MYAYYRHECTCEQREDFVHSTLVLYQESIDMYVIRTYLRIYVWISLYFESIHTIQCGRAWGHVP